MSRRSSTVSLGRVQIIQFPLWATVVALMFTMNLLNAEDGDAYEESETVVGTTDDKEKSGSEETSDEDGTKFESNTLKDEPSSAESGNKQKSLKQLITKAQELKSEEDSDEDYTKSDTKLGSYLPDGDPSSIVTVITNEDSITRLYEEIERLSRFR